VKAYGKGPDKVTFSAVVCSYCNFFIYYQSERIQSIS